jgi:hypothetical protein
MKRFALAGLLALSLMALSQQRASAGHNCSFSFGFNIWFNCQSSGCWNPCHGGCEPWPACIAQSLAAASLCQSDGYAAYAGDYGAYSSYAAQVPPQAAPASIQPAAYATPTYQPVGYYAPQGYGAFQAPSYWYGR